MAEALERGSAVAIVGCGAMGTGIAQVAALAGHRVLLFDARMNAVDVAKSAIAGALDALAGKGRIGADDARAAVGRIVPIHAVGDCASAKLVVEAIAEDMEVKRELFRQLEVVVSPQAILATNTSSLSITALAEGLAHPRRVVGMHFFNPAPLMPLVEVVSGLATDPDVAGTIHATAVAWGKTPVHARTTPGFIVNRCARPFYGEALRLIGERAADVATIDAILREGGGFRMGAFELMDLIGLDINYAVTKSVWEAYFHDPRFMPSIIQRERVAAGFLGRKSGRGFYDYTAGATPPAPSTEAPRARPDRVVAYGDLGIAEPLVVRLADAGIAIEKAAGAPPFPSGALAIGGAWLALTDGRSATARAAETGARELTLFDLALDYGSCRRLAVARADTCSEAAFAGAVGLLQAGGIAVSCVDDVPGLVVMRTVAMLANEAADAVAQGVAGARDVDLAMQKGVSYPLGPLAWADEVGVGNVREVLANLAGHYGEDRYRISPLISRRVAAGAPLHDD
jgi:3-hydroxybutyryl-CoA dehydrogenase